MWFASMKTNLPFRILVLAIIFLSVASSSMGQQSDLADLERRLSAVEAYLDKLPPSMATYVGSLEESINNYTKNLENGLNTYSERLQKNLESQLTGLSSKTIELDLRSQAYQKIETTTGMFLISVQDMEEIAGGYRLHLRIGNPNYADFRDFTLRLVWGSQWSPNSKLTFDHWRDTLRGAQYSFKGKLERGKWNEIEVDLIPATKEELAYVECELGIGAIELEMR